MSHMRRRCHSLCAFFYLLGKALLWKVLLWKVLSNQLL
jgi:hypothetical protein